MDKPIKKFTKEERENLLNLDDGRKIKVGKIGLTYEGVVAKLKKGLGSQGPRDAAAARARASTTGSSRASSVPKCKGARLNEAALGSKAQGQEHRRAVGACRSPTSRPSSAA